MSVETPQHIKWLTPYKPGKPIDEVKRERKLTKVVKLASNENPLGTSPLALQEARKALKFAHRYPDIATYALVQAIAKKFNKPAAEIICGSGTDSLISYMVMAFTSERDEVVTSQGTFIGAYVSTNKLGRTLKMVPLRDYHIDLEGIAAAITPNTKIVFLANANNPTGTYFSRQEFETFMKGLPNHCLVILDEAYHDYAHSLVDDCPDGMAYESNNLMVIRTLSKIYGLAGLRVGFAVGPEYLIREIYKVRQPFEPCNVAAAAAIGALRDTAFLNRTLKENLASLKRLSACFDELGIAYLESAANFFLLLFANEIGAAKFCELCLESGLIVRHVAPFGIPNGVRINSGTKSDTAFAITVIKRVHKKMMVE